MMPVFSREQVLSMAPDADAAKAAQSQAVAARWSALGHDTAAVWGECKGSGASPYRCQADLADGAARCSCPSRKLPCKHALGLLLLLSGGEVPAGESPGWVTEWLAARAARAAKPADEVASAETGTADPRAVARRVASRDSRAASRDSRVDGGVAELRRWLADLMRGGLAAAQAQPWTWWDQMARRMIDAQARGLAGYVRRLAELAAMSGQRADWPDRMLDQLGALQLLCEAWIRRSELPPDTAAAMRVRLGYTTPASEVMQAGRRVVDEWAVLGQRSSDDGQLVTLQQWLYGAHTGVVVTYLAFAVTGQSLQPGLPPGQRTAAELVLYPGTYPPRVLIAERADTGRPLGQLPGAASWQDALWAAASILAVDPWADIIPLAVRGVTVLPSDTPERPWLLRDGTGRAMPVAAVPEVRWRLLALSAGRPVDVAGEWDGFGFTPQAAGVPGADGQLIA